MGVIKVLHLVSTFQIKTDTKWLLRLLAKIDRAKFPIVVGAFYDDGPISAQLQALGIETFNLSCRSVWDLRVVRRLVKKIRQYDPDIVHTHLLRADIWGGLAGVLTGRRVISTVYAYGEYRRMYRRPWFDNCLDRMSTRFADRFLTVCDAIRDDLVERVGIDPNRIDVVHTGMDPITVDPERVRRKRQELNIGPTEHVVLMAARLSYEKGADVFLHAVRRATDRGINARYLIAGGGPMETSLKDLSRTLELSDRVRFLGFAEEVEVLMKLADLVVMPSLAEGLPNVALEAFAVGCPLVASRVGGLIDLAKMDSDAVFFAQPNDSADLADKIIQVLTEPMRTTRMIQGGRRILEMHLAIPQVARRYERVYHNMVEGPDPKPVGGSVR